MLPALPAIGSDLGVADANHNQLVVTTLMLGMAFGQVLYGPLSDSTGRKPAICLGLAIFAAGCLLSIFASSYALMLAGRFAQGLGVAGPRVVMIALVRDCYEGRAMARVMSFVLAVFILVPVIAPALGQGIALIAGWRSIFIAFLVLAVVMLVWFTLRQPETLMHERRVPFSLRRIAAAIREVCTNSTALGYTLASGLVLGPFLGYLSSAQQIFAQQYQLGGRFPLYFAVLAVGIGVGAYVNARLVMRLGMRLLCNAALLTISTLSTVFLVLAYLQNGHPALWQLMSYLLVVLCCVGILFGNLNALAMQPLGHIAGVGAAVIGSIATLLSVPLGVLVGHSYDGTVLPLTLGFAALTLMTLLVMRWVARREV
jgi:DHA1 family bicyclomycin/chloramphenicol resistance-like MFS transporter